MASSTSVHGEDEREFIDKLDSSYISDLQTEGSFINEICYNLDRSKKCYVGFSWARGFHPAVRVCSNQEKITFSLQEWYELMSLIPYMMEYFTKKPSIQPNIKMEAHAFRFSRINGVNYIQIIYHHQCFTINKNTCVKIHEMAPLIYKHLTILGMRNFRDYYGKVLLAATRMVWMNVDTAIETLCADVMTDNALCVMEAFLIAKDKVISDYIAIKTSRCQGTSSTSSES